MDLSEYQKESRKTAIYPRDSESIALYYATLGLVGEAGEISNKVKKVIRDKKGVFDEETKKALSDELGDVLWYLATFAEELGADLSEIAKENLKKLSSRMERGKLSGSGDNR